MKRGWETGFFSRRAAIGAVTLGAAGMMGCARKMPPDLSERGYKFLCEDAPEITEPGEIVKPDGNTECGWMRRPLLDLNFEDSRFYALPYFQRYRMKKWDMYYVITPTHWIQFLPAWTGYAAFAEVSIYDREKRTWTTGLAFRIPHPEFPIMRNSNAGVTEFKGGGLHMRFEVAGEKRKLEVDWPKFAGVGITADIELTHPAAHESICGAHLAAPRRAFYGEKITSMAASGKWRMGETKGELNPEDCYGLLDFGRGYYPPRKFWYWATGSGRAADGAVVGWNLGYGNDPRETVESAVFYNGRLHKMGVNRVELDFSDFSRPWRVSTEDGRVDLTFRVENLRENKLDLGYLYANGRMTLGRFAGHITLDSGERILVKDVFGLFEAVDQRW